jgi:hypothetical protein
MNRDARARFSPELRDLFAVHMRERPAFAIELHDEDTKTRVGKSDRMTGASLLAPTYDAAFDESLDLSNGHVADVGDLADYSARDILIAEGLFIHPHE